ncbi:hypothetical protein CLU84_4139 [Comamonas sp. 26]|nr:hypothetical protein CLU84_4139 [Comamonas sp. 26]
MPAVAGMPGRYAMKTCGGERCVQSELPNSCGCRLPSGTRPILSDKWQQTGTLRFNVLILISDKENDDAVSYDFAF